MPDRASNVSTKEEADLFDKLVVDFIPPEGKPPNFDKFCKIWNSEHVYPSLTFDLQL